MGVRVVLQTHGMVDPSQRLSARLLDAVTTKRVLRRAEMVLHLTDHERADLLAVEPRLRRLAGLPNGVPEAAEWPGRDVRKREVLFMARLHERKRPMDFVHAAAELAPDFPGWRFTLVGPDEGEGDKVTRRLRSLDDERISWEGPVAPDTSLSRLRQASLYVLPSVNEPFPMSVLEAMSCGLPVVVTDTCGLAETLHSSGSGLVTDGSVQALTASLKRLMEDDQLRQGLGARALATARHEFSMESVGRQLEKYYVLESRT